MAWKSLTTTFAFHFLLLFGYRKNTKKKSDWHLMVIGKVVGPSIKEGRQFKFNRQVTILGGIVAVSPCN